ncbi:LOW QUALITY PROTEIN: forkhead activin signal transducer 3-like [Ascaphus truei]|uniref:LOW QUALITY PROTEIN: forkhead activin signal transducer 3-like n=1 Tax=Ascaphus truei TaxID=8439 RepID=UPI003F59B216
MTKLWDQQQYEGPLQVSSSKPETGPRGWRLPPSEHGPPYTMSTGLHPWGPFPLHGEGGTPAPDRGSMQGTDPESEKENSPWSEGNGGVKELESTGEDEKKDRKTKKKNYHRYAKPPYSYLAMVALVIQNSAEKKLKLSQILKEISSLFPFFKGDYQGWKDSIRHNLSSNDCFRKVLKDPGKPQAKGNFWTVDVSRIPPEALKLQNTAITRQDGNVFTHDLTPYILHGQRYWSPELDCSLGTVQPSPPNAPSVDSPVVESSVKYPLLLWELPTSYTKCVPPNVVAPPSVNPFFPFSGFAGLSYYNYRPTPYVGPTYWGIMPGTSSSTEPPSPRPAPLEMDNMLGAFPPNKTVYDIWTSHPGDMLHPALYSQHLASGSVPLTGYRPI